MDISQSSTAAIRPGRAGSSTVLSSRKSPCTIGPLTPAGTAAASSRASSSSSGSGSLGVASHCRTHRDTCRATYPSGRPKPLSPTAAGSTACRADERVDQRVGDLPALLGGVGVPGR